MLHNHTNEWSVIHFVWKHPLFKVCICRVKLNSYA